MEAREAVLRSGPDIFLSYRRTDRPFVEQLVSVVEGLGPSVWWDADIEGGEDWRDSIVENLSASRCLVIVFSEACNSSKQLRKELAVADYLGKEVIPVLIEKTEPRGFFLYELAPLNWVNLYPAPSEKLDAVARTLVERLETTGWAALPMIASDAAASSELPPPVDETADVSANDEPVLAPLTLPTPADEAMTPGIPEPPVQVASHPLGPGGRGTRDTALAPPTLPPLAPPTLPPLAPPGANTARVAPALPRTRRESLRDVFPFRWIDFILPTLFGVLVLFGLGEGDSVAMTVGDALFVFVVTLALIGLIAFPIRYYRRRCNPYRVARNLLISNILFALAGSVAGIMTLESIREEGESNVEASVWFSVGLIILGLIIAAMSFVVFVVLSRIRAKRTFHEGTLQL